MPEQTSFLSNSALSDELSNAFETWLIARTEVPRKRLRDRSKSNYRRMWAAVASFLLSRELRLEQVKAADLSELLDSRQPRGEDIHASVRYGWSVLWLVQKIAEANDAPHAATAAARILDSEPYRYANAAGATVPDYLSPRAARQLIEHLQAPAESWKACRDKTAVALMLGAGLRPSETRTLTMNELVGDAVRGPWKVSLEPRGITPGHESPMARWASRLVRRWVDVRAQLEPNSDRLFFATAKGTDWSEPNMLTRCTVLMENADIGSLEAHGGLYRLRHTFALRQLARGRSDEEVGRWLGLTDLSRVARYRSVIMAPIEVA